jgi:DNA-binding SARP family transcriptional activator
MPHNDPHVNPGATPSEPRGTLELRLLGHAEVRLEGHALALGQRKTLALLAFLALEGEVGRERLFSVFWEDYDEDTARRNLRRELHRLREAGLRDHLEARADRLRLRQLLPTDVHRFEAAVRNGDVERALEVHRGELLADVRVESTPRFEAWLEGWRGRLAAQLRRVQLELAEHLETRGDWQRALSLHEAILRSDPLQEEQHRALMRLQHRLGQREAALRQFEQCKAILAEELGLEPLPATVQLAQQIRRSQVSEPLEANPSVQVLATSAWTPPFVGRQQALAKLAVSDAPLTLVTGEAGVGKTRLLEVAAPDGLRVRFRQISSQTPLYAVAECLREALNDPDTRSRFETLETIWQLETARLLPELSPEATARPAQERTVFLEALAQALSCAETDIIILEDLHWADGGSLELLAHLLRRSGRTRTSTRFVATARADELPGDTRTLLEEWRQDRLIADVNLEPLTRADVQHLVEDVFADGAVFAEAVFAATAGNSFYVCETLRHTLEQHGLAGDTASVSVAPSVRTAVLQRAERLGSATHRLLETAALTEDGFRLEDIQPATALSQWEALEALERAQGAHLIQALETGYGFAHDLTRQALQNTLGAERRRLIHSQLAQSLERADAAPARIAAHLEGAGKPAQAVAWRVRAAEAAERVYAHDQALKQYDIALNHQPPDTPALEILHARLGIWEQLGRTGAWQADLERLEVVATRVGSSATAALEFAKARFELAQQRPEAALRCAERILASVTDEATQAQAHHWAGAALLRQSQLEAARTHLERALELLPDSDGPSHAAFRGQVLMQLFQVEFDANNIQAAKAHLERALARNQTSKNLHDEILILNHQGRLALNEGDTDTAAKVFETAHQKVIPMNHPTLERTVLMGLATSYSRLLRLDEALRLLETALHLAEITDATAAKGAIHHTIGAVHRRRLEYDSTLKHYGDSLEVADQTQQHPARIFRRLTLVDLHLDIGDHATALSYLEEADAIIEQTGVRTERDWCDILSARRQRQAGNVNAARQALEGHEPNNPFERVIWLAELALTLLADRDYQAVLHLLEGEDAPDNTLSQLLGIRLQALAALKQPLETELQELRRLVDKGLMPVFTLHAHIAFVRTYRLLGQLENGDPHRLAAMELVKSVAATLGDHPAQRKSWLEQYAELF